jgi:hypothetical protein
MFSWKQLHALYYGSVVLTIAKQRETLHYDSSWYATNCTMNLNINVLVLLFFFINARLFDRQSRR